MICPLSMLFCSSFGMSSSLLKVNAWILRCIMVSIEIKSISFFVGVMMAMSISDSLCSSPFAVDPKRIIIGVMVLLLMWLMRGSNLALQ